jgi:hypothetical protein
MFLDVSLKDKDLKKTTKNITKAHIYKINSGLFKGAKL